MAGVDEPMISDVGSGEVAVIGMSVRFPGIVGLAEFWSVLIEGRCVLPSPPEVLDERMALIGSKEFSRADWSHKGLIRDLDQFEPEFFNLSPMVAANMDPQQRLLLESAWEALEDAGINPTETRSSDTGVFVGAAYNDYEDLEILGAGDRSIYGLMGGFRSNLSGRLSYHFDWHGPALVIDNACASSLVAVHLAVRSLVAGESSMALAAGVNLILHPYASRGFAYADMLSKRGRCQFGSVNADGFVRSEGVACIVLKRMNDALRDQDRIYSVIQGSAVGNDGYSSGFLMTPSREGHLRVIRKASATAGIRGADLTYYEAHGTGTVVGDRTEISALSEAVRGASDKCLIGSVKTNIGHTESTAGIAGLIKLSLCVHEGQVPPSLHAEILNPELLEPDCPLELCRSLSKWEVGTDGVRRGGVSSLGINGTNACVVVRSLSIDDPPRIEQREPPLPLLLSARTPTALNAMISAYREHLSVTTDRLPDVVRSAMKRARFPNRKVFVGATPAELVHIMDQDHSPPVHVADSDQDTRIAMVFSGMGTQWMDMGCELFAVNQAFRDTVLRCEEITCSRFGTSLLPHFEKVRGDDQVVDINRTQLIIFTIQAGLLNLLQRAHFTPNYVLGHSLGEIAAAYAAGILCLEDALTVVHARSRNLSRLQGQGGMRLVLANTDRVLEVLEEVQSAQSGCWIDIAACNAEEMTAVAGPHLALGFLDEVLFKRRIRSMPIHVGIPFHSRVIDPLLEELSRDVENIFINEGDVPFYSSVTGGRLTAQQMKPGYWKRNLRDRVNFHQAVVQMREDGCSHFLEVSPHAVLGSAIGANYIPTLLREQAEERSLQVALARLLELGLDINPLAVYDDLIFRGNVTLPTYPWQRRSLWLEGSSERPHRAYYDDVTLTPMLPLRPELSEEGELRKSSVDDAFLIQNWEPLADPFLTPRSPTFAPPKRWPGQVVISPDTASEWLSQSDNELCSYSKIIVWCPRRQEDLLEAGVKFHHMINVLANRLPVLKRQVHLVTCDALNVLQTEAHAPTLGTVAWGYLRALRLEQPDLIGRMIDLDETEPTLERLIAIVEEREDEPELALRQNTMFAPRIKRLAHEDLPVCTDLFENCDAFVVIGAQSRIGNAALWWLAEKYSRPLYLSSRTRRKETDEVLSELRGRGFAAEFVRCDITRVEDVKTLLDNVGRSAKAIGVLNLAGISVNRRSDQVTDDEFRAVLATKFLGACNLHQAVIGSHVCAIYHFSSLSGLLGAAHMTAYSAANLLLDSVAAQARFGPAQTRCCSWGVWKEAGVATPTMIESWCEAGLKPFSTETGIRCLDRTMTIDLPGLIVAQADWSRVNESLERHSDIGQLRGFKPVRLESKSRDLRSWLLSAVGQLLGAEPAGLNPDRGFFQLGMDSLMLTKLRHQLSQEQGIEVPPTALFDHPSIARLVDFIERIEGAEEHDLIDDLLGEIAGLRQELGME
jgi:acyl transferase domain-containing protein/acyl carrier protein